MPGPLSCFGDNESVSDGSILRDAQTPREFKHVNVSEFGLCMN